MNAKQRRRKLLDKWRGRYAQYVRSKDWKRKRASKFYHVGRRCEKCGATRGKMHVHHRTYERLGAERLEDLQVLCGLCHQDLHLAEAFGVSPDAFDQLAWRI